MSSPSTGANFAPCPEQGDAMTIGADPVDEEVLVRRPRVEAGRLGVRASRRRSAGGAARTRRSARVRPGSTIPSRPDAVVGVADIVLRDLEPGAPGVPASRQGVDAHRVAGDEDRPVRRVLRLRREREVEDLLLRDLQPGQALGDAARQGRRELRQPAARCDHDGRGGQRVALLEVDSTRPGADSGSTRRSAAPNPTSSSTRAIISTPIIRSRPRSSSTTARPGEISSRPRPPRSPRPSTSTGVGTSTT